MAIRGNLVAIFYFSAHFVFPLEVVPQSEFLAIPFFLLLLALVLIIFLDFSIFRLNSVIMYFLCSFSTVLVFG